MRKFLQSVVILTFISSSFQLKAQEPSRFPITPTSVWRINYEYYCSGEEFTHQPGDQEYKYFVNGDTLIGGKTYFKLYKTGILYLETPVEIRNKYMGALRDSANRYYFIGENENTEVLLYNFDAKVGESICPDCDGMDYIVGEIDTLENGRQRFFIDVITVHCGSSNTLIEGIGWMAGLLEGNACYAHPGIRGSYLICYSENGNPVFATRASHRCAKDVECSDIFTPVNQYDMSDFNPRITLNNNRVLEISYSNHTVNNLCEIEVLSITGQKLKTSKMTLPGTVDVSTFGKGIYLVRVSNGQKAVTSKVLIR
jgi:hypothetical protein